MITAPEHLQQLSDRDLVDEIHNQQTVVDDCIELAQYKAGSVHDDNRHQCTGLYFAQLRYQQLIAELTNRFQELSNDYNHNPLND